MPDAEQEHNNYLLNKYVNEWINTSEHGRHRKLFKAGNFYQGKERM